MIAYLLSNGASHLSRPYTILGEKIRFVHIFVLLFTMADFDAQQAQVHAQALQNQFDNDQARIAYLEQSVANMAYALHQIQNVPPPVHHPQFHPNLNLSPPPPWRWRTTSGHL